MTTTLGIDFDQVPNQHVPLNTGVYTFQIAEEPTVQPNSKQDGTNVVVVLKLEDDVMQDGQAMKGEQVTYYISSKSRDYKILCKRLFLAAGIKPTSSTTLAELTGKMVKASVAKGPYTDKNGVTKESTSVKELMVPPEML